jgi:hypothetical protein
VSLRAGEELDPGGRRLRAALAAVLVSDNTPELRLLREWLNNWSGLGLIVAGMTHQGWDLQLTAYSGRDRRANFFPVGIPPRSWAGLPGSGPVPVTNLTGERDDDMILALDRADGPGGASGYGYIEGYGYVEKIDRRRKAQVERRLLRAHNR